MAEEVFGADAIGDEAAEVAGGGERQAEENCRGSLAGQGDAAGCSEPKALRPGRRRQLVDEVRGTWRVSIRRACRVLRTDTSTYHYKGRRGDQAVLSKRVREIAQTQVRYGYRRIHVLLRRENPASPGRGRSC
jgi:putative transposase